MTIEAKNDFVILTAENGMIFRNKISGDILTKKLYLGCNDTANNYEEVDESEADIYVLEEESNTVQTEEKNGV